MRIQDFALERYFARWEFAVRHLLCASDVEAWRLTHDIDYDLVHGNYWLSGVVGLTLRARWGVPLVQMFHTLGALKNGAGVVAEHEPVLRLAEERRIVAAADRLVAANAIERDGLVNAYDADPARVAVIPCGVDTDLFTSGDPSAARAALELPPGPLLLYVGRIAPIKGSADATGMSGGFQERRYGRTLSRRPCW